MKENMMTLEEAKRILKKKKVQIVIPEGEKKVIAYITNCQNDLIYSLIRRDYTAFSDYDYESLAIQDTYRAIAKCHPEDVYDAAKGIEIATIKLATKYQNSKKKVIQKVVSNVEKQLYSLL